MCLRSLSPPNQRREYFSIVSPHFLTTSIPARVCRMTISRKKGTHTPTIVTANRQSVASMLNVVIPKMDLFCDRCQRPDDNKWRGANLQ